MHELSIALAIVEAASEEASRHGAQRVTEVRLKLGQLSGVVKSALLASYEMAAEGSPLAGSKLAIEDVAVVVFCPTCGVNRAVVSPQQMSCVECGTLSGDIVAGREMEVVGLEIVQ
jgi:hydrogenase nickel incorporation protein HypA/HybF